MATLEVKNSFWWSMCRTKDADVTCVIWKCIYNRIETPTYKL